MAISTRKAVLADRARVLALIDSARGDGLSALERAEQGFVQGHFDEHKLASIEATTGIYVAEEDGQIAGAALTSATSVIDEGPPRLTVDAALRAASRRARTGSTSTGRWSWTGLSADAESYGVCCVQSTRTSASASTTGSCSWSSPTTSRLRSIDTWACTK